MSSEYERARDLAESDHVEESWKIIKGLLVDNPNDPRALVTASFLMRKRGHFIEAYHFAKSATQSLSWDAATWINLGHAASELWLADEAESAYKKGLNCPNINEGTLRRNCYLNLSAVYIDNARYEEAASYARRMLEANPQDRNALSNLGFCQLAMRDWSGWKNYRYTLGSEWRPKTQYKDEPEWDGTEGKRVVIYGEQGLGDEISFASMLPDAIARAGKVVLECDPRLRGLFKRSFPGLTVYGTRGLTEAKWAKADWEFDCSLPVGQLGEYFRVDDADFPGTPYLEPCPQRTLMWQSYFATLGKPVIGIAWRGGIPRTNAKARQLMLDDFGPLMRQCDAHYVSLQYKDASKEIEDFKRRHPEVDIAQYPWATLTNDYDDTAAMIGACDYVFCMQTAVAHTAGAIGVPVTVLVPVASQWRYGTAKESIPWYSCLRVIRQKRHGSWTEELQRGADQVIDYLKRVSGYTRTDAPSGDLRECGGSVRPDDLRGYKANGGGPSAGLRVREPVHPDETPET